ncbi:glycosyl hydrolase [Aspergillus pseudonomiae]|uniref:Glycosyl hydrolase n=1 Tax=Aspergillus pseudonomiae TaxID=1506151 RepID=A0A5N7D326_9EURO|nr:glycosyl hydrolase [Aspergillus pseudonomiae]KAE8400805.1 glycosyl hydrolase [Aspergillus pseudonomiae]
MSPGSVFASSFLLLLGGPFTCAGFARADNPIVQNIYTTDPAPIVHDGRVFVFTGHDEDNSTWYTMLNWRLFSSADMVNWQHHGSPMSLNTFAWADADAWAGQVIARNDKFYFYAPVRHRATATKAIGVGVSDNITGPYTDALGHPLVENGAIDPTVYIDDDGQAYMYWGNPGLWYVKLNEDMISYSGSVTPVDLTVDGFGSPNEGSGEETSFDEAPWTYKRDDIYYMIFAGNCCPENIRYSTGTSITGPWTYQGVIMPTQGASFTNHPGIVDFADRSYFFYHNGALPSGSGYTRSVAVEEFTYNSDGTIPEINMTEDGPAQVGNLDPYSRQEAETIAWSDGIDVESSNDGGIHVAYINNGDYIKVKGVAFGDGASSFAAGVASAGNGGHIDLRLDSKDGTAIGACSVPITGGWQAWETVNCSISDATSTHDLFFVFTGDSTEYLFNFDWWQFS